MFLNYHPKYNNELSKCLGIYCITLMITTNQPPKRKVIKSVPIEKKLGTDFKNQEKGIKVKSSGGVGK